MAGFVSLFLPRYPHFVSSTCCRHSFITAGAWAGIALVFCAVISRLLFFLEGVGHQAGLANLLLLLGGHFHHAFTVFFSLWVCLQGSFWIFWRRGKSSIIGMYCVGGSRCRGLGLSLSVFLLGEYQRRGKAGIQTVTRSVGSGSRHTLHLEIT